MEASAAPRPTRTVLLRPGSLLRRAGDERLVAEVRAGSEVAFEVIYDRHHRGILGFCRHMLGSREEAEDAVQHTFMAAYRALVASEKPIQLKAWLYTIARNRCLTVLRARREHPSDTLEELSTDGLSTEVELRQDLRDLLRDVAGLPDDQRAALVLAEVGGLGHDEIAAILACPDAKVKALVYQARSSLAASRVARETPCTEIRLQLANLHGGSLRRTTLRRHVRECAGCREFKGEMADQRRALAIALPVVPALGLKEAVLGGVLGGGGGAAGGGVAVGGGVAATGIGGVGIKALVVIAVAGGGGAAGVVAFEGSDRAERPAARKAATAVPAGGGLAGGRTPGPAGGAAATVAEEPEHTPAARSKAHRSGRVTEGASGRPQRDGPADREQAPGNRDTAVSAPRETGGSEPGASGDDQQSRGEQPAATSPAGGTQGEVKPEEVEPRKVKRRNVKPKSSKPKKVKPKSVKPDRTHTGTPERDKPKRDKPERDKPKRGEPQRQPPPAPAPEVTEPRNPGDGAGEGRQDDDREDKHHGDDEARGDGDGDDEADGDDG